MSLPLPGRVENERMKRNRYCMLKTHPMMTGKQHLLIPLRESLESFLRKLSAEVLLTWTRVVPYHKNNLAWMCEVRYSILVPWLETLILAGDVGFVGQLWWQEDIINKKHPLPGRMFTTWSNVIRTSPLASFWTPAIACGSLSRPTSDDVMLSPASARRPEAGHLRTGSTPRIQTPYRRP